MCFLSTLIFLAFIFSLFKPFNLPLTLYVFSLCLEGMMLSLFILSTILALNMYFTLLIMLPIILLMFAAREAGLGLSLLVNSI